MSEKTKKIVMIGPVYPYKGGISHYNSLMYRSLSQVYDTEMITFKLQYPKILFHKEQRDYKNKDFKIAAAKYWINTVNPFNWIHSAKKIKRMMPDLIIFQWWHPYFAPCYWVMEKCLRKFSKLFLCHNIFPHERFPLDRWLVKKVLKKGDYFLVHSAMDEQDLLSIIENPIYKKIVHPTYNVFKMQNLTKAEAREQLHILEDEKVLLFFGFVRSYKGLKHLLRALPQICERIEHIRLLIVGEFGSDKQSYMDLIENCCVKGNISLFDDYIPDCEVEKFFAACDLVVLPYESATQSGIVQIAYGFGKGVIVTRVGGLPEVVESGETGYIIEPENPGQITEAVVDYYTNEREVLFEQGIAKAAYKYSWDRMVETIDTFLEP